MTDYNKIRKYYSVFDEQHRLEKAEGRLEFEMNFKIILEYIKKSDNILDLGGGAGKYAIELSKRGFRVTLADLSEQLLEQAQDYIKENNIPALQSVDVVNAINLSCYARGSFDVVILFGPLYHLLEQRERERCVSEVARVIKPKGIILVNFIPYLSGAVGVVTRALNSPEQVNEENLSKVFETGKFCNKVLQGFQEGYYPTSAEMEQLFGKYNFRKILLRSVRSFGYGKEEKIYELLERDKVLFDKIMELIDRTATDPAIIETCGHAVYVGYKGE